MVWKLYFLESPKPVYYFAKIFGLAPFTLKNNILYPSNIFSILINPVICIVVLVRLLLRTNCGKDLSMDRCLFQENISLAISMRFTIILIILIMFQLKHKSIICLIKKLCDVSKELEKIGIQGDCRKFFKNLFGIALITNALLSTMVIIDKLQHPWTVFGIIEGIMDLCTRFNVVMCLSQTLLLTRRYFTHLNKKLSDILPPTSDMKSSDCTRLFIVNQKTFENGLTHSEDLTVLRTTISKIEALHFGICDLVDRTIEIFAMPILLLNVHFILAFITSFDLTYIIVRIIAFETSNNYFVIANIWFSVFDTVMTFSELVIVSYASVSVCLQRSATKSRLIKIWNEIRPKKLQNKFRMFSLGLFANPVTVSAFGFFNLDYSRLVEILAIAFAYMIFRIQLSTP